MFETAGIALTTFFAVVGPLDAAAVFAALTIHQTSKQKRKTAIRCILAAAGILLVFALIGELILSRLGISLAALRTSGGILMLLVGIDLVFARSSGSTSTTEEEEQEAVSKEDISIFPLATPLIAGAGAMGAAILLMADQKGDLAGQVTVLVSLLTILLFTFFALLLATPIQRLLGVTGMQVISRIAGVLLSALAVQFIFDGVQQSWLANF